jgi:hypothetical protein
MLKICNHVEEGIKKGVRRPQFATKQIQNINKTTWIMLKFYVNILTS